MARKHLLGPAWRAMTMVCWLSIPGMTVVLVGCSAGAGSGNSGNNISVSLTNKVTSVQAGTVVILFLATVQNDSTNGGVSWSLTANGASCSPACGSLSLATSTTVTYMPPSSGPTAPNNQPTLTATSVAKTSKLDSDTFTITPALAVSITNTFTSVNTGASAFVVNATVQNDSTNSGVSWALACSGSTCGTLTGTTKTSVTYAPPSSAPTPPNVTLTATSVHDGSKSYSDSFTVVTAPISVSIGNKISTVYAPGNAILFSANVENDPSGSGVTWTLTANGSSCTPGCGTISAGKFSTTYTPPSTVPASPNTTLTAVSSADGTKSDFDKFTISVPPPISVGISQISSAIAGSSGSGITFDASVQNDSSGSGVTWTLTCPPSTTCGSLSGNTTTTVNYMPPTTAPASPNNWAMITATSLADNTKSGSDTLTITTTAVANNCSGAPSGQESLLHGNYALVTEGFWRGGSGTPMLIAASFAANGGGSITGGEEDTNDTISPQHLTVTANGSLYTVGADHRGCLQLTNSAGTTTVFRFSVGGINAGIASKGRIIEFDDNSGTGSRGSGILRLQDTTAFTLSALQPQYAFGVGGWTQNGSQWVHLAAAGSFSNGSGSLSNATFDENTGGILFPEASGIRGSISSISASTGRGIATLDPQIFDWAIYVINASEFFLIGTDPANFNPVSMGIAVTTGASFTASSLSGNYVVHTTGNANGSADATLELLSMTPGGAQAGTLSGTVDSYGAGNGAQSTTLSGVPYNVDPSAGRTILGNPGDNLPILYVTTPTDGIAAFVMGVGADALFGTAEAQTSQSLPLGTYAFGAEDPADNTVSNKSGAETISSGGALAGTYDQSNTSGLLSGQAVSATVSLGSDGTGNIGPNTVAITSGSKLYSLDESAGAPAVIVVAEQ